MKSILTPFQGKVLNIASHDPVITKTFYLTGGTALAQFYLQHRYSEDLDFFSEQPVDPNIPAGFIEANRRVFGIKSYDQQTLFNRNIFFLDTGGDKLKLEFNWYLGERIEQGLKYHELTIDSVYDIAVNKIFTVRQHPRARDYVDLYFIHKKYQFDFWKLAQDARNKFDMVMDPLQSQANFLKVREATDWPRMIQPLDKKALVKFFEREALKLSKKIFE